MQTALMSLVLPRLGLIQIFLTRWLHIDGYSLFRLDRSSQRGGGVCIYSQNDVPCKAKTGGMRNGVEVTWLEVGSKEKTFFGCVYRPPQERTTFWDDLDEILSDVERQGARMVLVGDINADVTPTRSTTDTNFSHLTELCAAHKLKLDARSPTCISLRSPPSTLDLLLISDADSLSTTVVDVPFSDHSMVYTELPLNECRNAKRLVESRNLKAIDIDNLQERSSTNHSDP